MKVKNYRNMKSKLVAFLLILTMCAWLWPWNLMEVRAATKQPENPKVTANSTTWDCVWFGRYKQSSDGKGGFKKEPIKWRVLSVNGNEAFLLADQVLDAKPYNETFTNVTWATSTVRSWLNGYSGGFNLAGKDYRNNSFVNMAFNDQERTAIKTNLIENKDHPDKKTPGGSNTSDKIFFLSLWDAVNEKYGFPYTYAFSNTRMALNSDYAEKQGARIEDNTDGVIKNGRWWLRSPGADSARASYGQRHGGVDDTGMGVNNTTGAVRPALYLNLNSDDWSYAGTVSSSSNGTTKDEEPVPTYKISYDANGGSGVPAPQTKYHGETLTLSGDASTRTGYDFLGWSESKNADTATYKRYGNYTSNSGITLYAVWKPKEYTVIYDANGGSGGPSTQTKRYGETLILSSETPIRTGYTFQGWATNRTASDATYSAGGSYASNGSVTLYAVWKLDPNHYVVSYDANGGKGAPFPQAKTQGEPMTLSNAVPTRTGYEFVGWSEDRKTAAYQAGDSYVKDGNATLYALWRLIKQADEGAIELKGPQEKADGTIQWDCLWFGNYKQNADGNGDFKKEPIKWRVLSREGNDAFLIADQNLDCKKYNETDESVTWETCTLRSWLNNDFLKAAFGPAEQQAIQTVNVDNGTEGGSDTTDRIYLPSIEEMTKSTYGFSADYDAHDEKRRSKNTDYAKEQGAYTSGAVGYEGNGWWWLRSPGESSDSAANVDDYGTVSRSGAYVDFAPYAVRPVLHVDLQSNRWSYAGTISSDGTMNEKAPTYKISYDANGGTGAPSTQTKHYDEALTLSGTIPTRTGYDFLGWSENKTASAITYKAGDSYANNSSMLLYAMWKERPKTDGNQNQGSKDEGGQANGEKGKLTQTISVSSKTLTYKGKSVSLKVKTTGNGKLSYSSNNKKVVTVSASGVLKPKECGTAKITIKAAGTGEYKATEKTITVKVILKKPVLKLKRTGRTSVKATWKKVPGATGYQVSFSDTKKKTTSLKKTKKRLATARALKRGKKYQFKIRAYRKVGKKTIYGPYSKTVKIRW